MEKINLVDFKKRKLKNFYLAVQVITKKIRIRAETCIVEKDLVVLLGTDIFGNRNILGMFFENKNDNRFWLEIFEDFKARGVENILFFVSPPNKNIERCVKIIYNSSKLVNSPHCITFSFSRFFAEKPSRKMQIDFKNLFFATNKDEYFDAIELFKQVYVDNKIIMLLIEKKQHSIEQFYEYDYDIRKFLYPYYTIKEFSKSLNKLITKEPLCSNINEVIEFLLPVINSFEKGRSYNKLDWLNLISNIYEDYSEILEEYLNV